MRISDWSSDVCSSDLGRLTPAGSAGFPDSRWKRLQPRILADAPESMDPRLRGDDGQRLFRSAGELLRQHPLLEVVLGIEQTRHRTVARLADHDLHHVAHLVRIGGRADRPLVREIGTAPCGERGWQYV